MHHATRIVPVALALGLALSMPVLAAGNASQDASKAQAKVSEADARKTALASVANGTVQKAKLVNEKGRQVWSFDLASSSSTNVVNVQVDANSGRIVSKSIRSPAQAAAAGKTK